jgi:hypothetical protein
MRTAFATIVAITGLAVAAQAQESATAPAAGAAPVASTPAAPPAATPMPGMTMPGMTMAPAATPAPAAPATTAAPTPPPPAGTTAGPAGAAPVAADAAGTPTMPTTGDGAVVLSILQRVCVPLVKGGNFDQLAKSAGMKKVRGGAYVAALGGNKAYTITVQPPGSNSNVCQTDIHYALGGEQPIITALNVYSFLHDPELQLQRNDYIVGGDNIKRITLSWEHYTDKESTGIVFVQLKSADGAALSGKYDQATLLYSERTF